jgi:hypothetical protein
MRRSKPHLYSITSSARTSNAGGTVILFPTDADAIVPHSRTSTPNSRMGTLQNRAEQQSF